MKFITVPSGTVVKGQTYQMYVDKAALAQNTKVAADDYFSNSARWQSFSLLYKSSALDQMQQALFDAKLASPVANFKLSDTSAGLFRVFQFRINDFDGGHLDLFREDMDVADFLLEIPLKIPPAQMLVSVINKGSFSVADATNYAVNDYVVLFNNDTNLFEADTPRKIVNKVGNTLYVDPIFDTQVLADVHSLRFPNATKCSANQVINYYFNT